MIQRYLIALGSNRRHQRHGPPEQVLRAALRALQDAGIVVLAVGPILRSAPLGPSRRRYANGAALIQTSLSPPDLLDLLKQIEAAFGRRSGGQRWTSRVLDLDLILWSGGAWSDPHLTIPHREFRQRDFVLGPALTLAPAWRDPITALSLRQLYARLTRPRPIPR
ncbi:MAG: 2-amino-4-hydroxy-6-hydroxymethyldihydropteridine diphosphokinase [Novosphingobium sp.]